MTNDNLRSQSLDLLRFPLAVVVITIHAAYPSIYQETGDSFILNGIVRIAAGMLFDQSVPIYFFISGFVFFLNIRLTKDVYIRKLRNRIKSLFIPYMIWNSAAILKLLIFTLPCLAVLFNNPISLSDLDLSVRGILMSFYDMSHSIFPVPLSDTREIFPIDCPMWFVRDLIIIVLFTPLIYKVLVTAGKHATALLTVLGIVWFISGLYGLGHINQLLTGFFFFSWGGYMGISNKDMLHEFGRFFKLSIFLYIILSISYAFFIQDNPDIANAVKKANQCAGLILVYNISSLLIRKNICRVSTFLASASFFIYASNWLILFETKILILRLVNPQGGAGFILCDILTIATVTCALLSVYYAMGKCCPKLLETIAGRKRNNNKYITDKQ